MSEEEDYYEYQRAKDHYESEREDSMSALDNVIAGYSQRIASDEQLRDLGEAKTELDRLRDIEKSYQAWLVTDDASHIFTKVCDERDEWKRDALRVEKERDEALHGLHEARVALIREGMERDAALAACSAKDEALADLRLIVTTNANSADFHFERGEKSGWMLNEWCHEDFTQDASYALAEDEHGVPVISDEARRALLRARGGQ